MQDVTMVFDEVTKKYSKKIIIGYSIGTGIAASLASVRKNNLLILKAPYDNFVEYSNNRAPYFSDFLKKVFLRNQSVFAKNKYSYLYFPWR